MINKERIKDAQALSEYEADITLIRQLELEKYQLIKGRFGISHLKNIHKYVFQDVYPFAGKFRTEDISKDSTDFCKSEFIKDNLERILHELKDEGCLKELKADRFADRAAYFMAEINMIHPFREGNGRAIREFIRQLALQSGHLIDWSLIDSETLLRAMILAVDKDYSLLSSCILKVIDNQ